MKCLEYMFYYDLAQYPTIFAITQEVNDKRSNVKLAENMLKQSLNIMKATFNVLTDLVKRITVVS